MQIAILGPLYLQGESAFAQMRVRMLQFQTRIFDVAAPAVHTNHGVHVHSLEKGTPSRLGSTSRALGALAAASIARSPSSEQGAGEAEASSACLLRSWGAAPHPL
eukprot:11324618-Alexandrium_andersonii.AAC.1